MAVPLAGCDLYDRDEAPPPAADPLHPLLTEALALAASYRAAAGAAPELADRLTPIAETHEAHAAELARVIGATLSSSAPNSTDTPPAGGDAALSTLRQAEQAARNAAVTACAAAPAERAALVGSIAAARATHVEALR